MPDSRKMRGQHVQWVVAIVLIAGLTPTWAQDTQMKPDVRDSQVDHGNALVATDAKAGNTSPAMDHGAMQGGSAPPDARDPHAYSDGLDFGAHRHQQHSDQMSFASLLVDRLEAVRSRDQTLAAYDLQFRYGRDYDRLVLQAEGEVSDGRIETARTELHWGHAVAAYWDTQLGVRHDGGAGPSRTWLAFGVQGLAPYWFEVNATAYVGDEARSALRLEVEYELLLTQKFILQPRIEANLYGERDVERGLGSGLSDLSAGLRLRYEIRREFAPYLGIEWAGKFGGTADYARAAGEEIKETRLVAGLRFWY